MTEESSTGSESDCQEEGIKVFLRVKPLQTKRPPFFSKNLADENILDVSVGS